MNDHRLGWPAALLALERDERPSHVTPPRDKPKQLTFFEAVDFGKYVHFITEEDCRQIKSRVISVDLAADATPNSQQADAEGWIPWQPEGRGFGKRPAGSSQAKLRNGQVLNASIVYSWGDKGGHLHDYQVIAYRVAPQAA